MAGRGPAPKPANIRQRTNRKTGRATLSIAADLVLETPEIPNPDEREWHPLTLKAWANAWASPMASQWLASDFDGLARLAILWDNYNKTGMLDYIKEIRLQSASYGLTPLDRSRLQWEVSRADEAEQKQSRRADMPVRRTGTADPRRGLMAVK